MRKVESQPHSKRSIDVSVFHQHKNIKSSPKGDKIMAITASEIYSPVIDQPFDDESYTKELEGNNKEIKFEKGSKTVKVRTVVTAGAVTNHDATDTFSEQIAGIVNVDSTINTYTLDQAKDIKQFLDRTVVATNNSITEGGKVLHAIVAEQLVPLIDAYRLGILAAIAVVTGQNVTATDDGYEDVLSSRAYLINARLGKKMIGYCNTTTADSIRLSGHLIPYTQGLEKTLRTGDIGMLGNISIKEVPADIMPTNTGMIIVNPDIVSAPRFLDDSKVGESAAAFGSLLLCLYMYTCVVSTPKQKGVATIVTGASV